MNNEPRGPVLALSILLWAGPHVARADAGEKTAEPAEPPDKAALSHISDEYEREGDEQERRGAWKECGRSMLAAAATLPDHPRHATRLAKTAHCFQKAKLVGQALKARMDLITAHPRDPLVCDALFDVAAGYHQMAYYSKAATCYEVFASAFPRDKRAAAALANVKEFTKAVEPDEECISGVDSSLGTGGSHSRDRRRESRVP